MVHVNSVSISSDVTIRLPIVSVNVDVLENESQTLEESRMNTPTFVGRTNTSVDLMVNILNQTI
jgi:hypothetical protein